MLKTTLTLSLKACMNSLLNEGMKQAWNLIREAYNSEAAAFSWQVCKLIKPEQRMFNLSFKHYKEDAD